MNRSNSPFKPIIHTSIMKNPKAQPIEDLNLHSNIKFSPKIHFQSPQQSSNELINFLLSKLVVLQEKQKQNQNKFLDCVKCLKQQIAIKDKINQSLRDQIVVLKQQLNGLKINLDKIKNFPQNNCNSKKMKKNVQIKVLKASKKQNSFSMMSLNALQKQNINPYMIQSQCSNKHSKKLSQALAKTQESECDKSSKLQFKMDDFMKQNKLTKMNQYYHHHMSTTMTQRNKASEVQRRPLKLRNSPWSRKGKSKSIGGILKTKLFVK